MPSQGCMRGILKRFLTINLTQDHSGSPKYYGVFLCNKYQLKAY